jgi:D-glycero-D-manno-heptose 1,7-bisphosphate phosphatase
MRPAAVFLDRDGVLNRVIVRDGKPYPPAGVAAVELCLGVGSELARLRAAGFALIAVTNQPDVARGTQTRQAVEAINAYVRGAFVLDAIYTCYEDCESPRRKPNPGMLLEAAVDFSLDLGASYVVGDRWKDVEAGHRAGCKTVFVDYDYRERRPHPPAMFTAASPSEALGWIASRHQRNSRRPDRERA